MSAQEGGRDPTSSNSEHVFENKESHPGPTNPPIEKNKDFKADLVSMGPTKKVPLDFQAPMTNEGKVEIHMTFLEDSPNLGSTSSSTTLHHRQDLESGVESPPKTKSSPSITEVNVSKHELSLSEDGRVDSLSEQQQQQPIEQTNEDHAQVQSEEEEEEDTAGKIKECFEDLGFTPPRHIGYLASGQFHDVYHVKFSNRKNSRLRRNKQCHHLLSQDMVFRIRKESTWKWITRYTDSPQDFVDTEFKDGVALAMVLQEKRMGPPVYFFDATGKNQLGRSFMISRYWKGTKGTGLFEKDDEPSIKFQKAIFASVTELLTRAETVVFDAAGRVHATIESDKGCTQCIKRSTQHSLTHVVPFDADLVDRYRPDSARCLLTQIDNVLYSRLLDSMRYDQHQDVPPLLALWYTLMDVQDMLSSDVIVRDKQRQPILVLTDATPYNTIISSSGCTVKRSVFIDPDNAVSASATLKAFIIETKNDGEIEDVTRCDDRDKDSNICQVQCRFQPRKRDIPTTSDLDIVDYPWEPLQLQVAQDVGKNSDPSRLFCTSLTRQLIRLYNEPLYELGITDRIRRLHWHSGLMKSLWVKQQGKQAGPLHFRQSITLAI
ncbi:MAG: hypothetical protein Q9225_001024 [Loekoesia sp. 1 TL-2023]